MKKFFIIVTLMLLLLGAVVVYWLSAGSMAVKNAPISNIKSIQSNVLSSGPYWETPSGDNAWESIVIEPVFKPDILRRNKPSKASPNEEQVYDESDASMPIVRIF